MNFKRVLVLFLIFVVVSLILADVAEESGGERINIVLLPVTYSQQSYAKYAEMLYGLMEEALVNAGRFNIVSKADIKKVMKERNLIDMGLISDKDIMEIGKISGGRYLIYANITRISTKKVGEKRIFIFFKLYEEWDAEVSIHLKVLDITNGELLADKIIKADAVDVQQITHAMFGKASYPHSEEDAIKQALENTSYRIELALREFFPIKISKEKVKRVDDYTIEIPKTRVEMKKGYIFKIGKTYAYVAKIDDNRIILKSLYGEKLPSNIADIKEFPVSPYRLGLGLGTVNGEVFGFNVFVDYVPVADPFSLGIDGGYDGETVNYAYVYALYKMRAGKFINGIGAHYMTSDIGSGVGLSYVLYFDSSPDLFGRFSIHYSFGNKLGITLGGGKSF